jgi:hypothetical protein
MSVRAVLEQLEEQLTGIFVVILMFAGILSIVLKNLPRTLSSAVNQFIPPELCPGR